MLSRWSSWQEISGKMKKLMIVEELRGTDKKFLFLFSLFLNCHWLSDENFFSLKPKPFVTDVTPFPVLYIVTLVRYYIWFPVQYIFYNTVIAQKDLSESVTELFIVFRRLTKIARKIRAPNFSKITRSLVSENARKTKIPYGPYLS